MASYDTSEDKLIIDRFNAQWDANTTPVQYPNESEEAPTGITEWVRLAINSDVSRLADVVPDRARHRFLGQVIVQVFTKRGTGSARNTTLCQNVIDIFNWHTIEPETTQLLDHDNTGYEFHDSSDWDVASKTTQIIFRTAHKRTIGPDGAWYQQNVIAPYHRDSLISLT